MLQVWQHKVASRVSLQQFTFCLVRVSLCRNVKEEKTLIAQ